MNKKTVVIVLGNRLNDDGTITIIQKERLELAKEIEKTFNPDYYILSGGLANVVPGKTEAEAMYDYLVNDGTINQEKLIMEKDSLTTVQNAHYSIPIAKQLGAELIIVCSSPYHYLLNGSRLMESFTKELEGSNIPLMVYTKKLYDYNI